MTDSRTLTIDIWSDIVCPFCYLGDTQLEQALEDFEHRDNVEIKYHSYELMPELGHEPVDLSALLASRYSPEQMKMQNEQITARGAELGIEYNFDQAVTVNTLTAHRLLKLGDEVGKGHDLVKVLFRAYFTDGQHIGDIDTLVALAEEAGIDGSRAREVLHSDEYADDVAADIDQAKRFGIQGVPFFVLNNKYGVSGAQPREAFLQALDTAWADA